MATLLHTIVEKHKYRVNLVFFGKNMSVASVSQKYQGVVELFKKLAEERRFGPIDRLARALTHEMIRIAVYEALRIGVSEGWNLPTQQEIDIFISESEKNPGIAQKIAAIALTAYKPKQKQLEEQQQKQQQEQKQ